MKIKVIIYIVFVFLLSVSHSATAQSIVSNIKAKRNEQRHMLITYDINGIDTNIRYHITAFYIPSNKEEKTIELSSATGDIGDNVKPGTGKEILWNPFSKDSIMKSKGVFKIVALRYPDQMVYVSKNNTSVTEDFWMDQYEVTRSQFNEFITSTGYITDADKKNPSFVKTKSGWEQNKGITWHYEIDGEKRKISTGNESVSFVSWNDAVAYCKWKNKRLPSAVEWEYAALGGKYSKGSKYSGGNFLRDIAWYKENTDMKKLHQPGLKIPNELYIYDMNGNVSEWIFDTAEKLNDGQEKKIVKGGSIYSDEASISITANLGEKQNVSYSDIGFRCACSINK